MKQNILVVVFATIMLFGVTAAKPVHALSCIPVDMFLKDTIGKDDTVIFTGTSLKRIEENDYTAEVIAVTHVKQGYVEEKVFVYHHKNETWGYLCNAGPVAVGTESLYIAYRDNVGKYMVSQRLTLTDSLVKTIDADLKVGGISGEIVAQTAADHSNQLMETITDLFKEILILLKEQTYWKS
jgi:hypothetical protein